MKSILDYNFPEDLKSMSLEELQLLAIQIREFLVDNISKTGGHLASSLGVVELTIALHTIFDLSKDRLIWDVGHQSYTHKILSGRAKEFPRLRKIDGMSGFPKVNESQYDAFDTGHSSNSISAIAGMAKARDLLGLDFETIAVIGDGALTGGLAYEGLNNLGDMKSKAIVIINDNGMSIGRNTGGMSSYLGKLRLSSGYTNFKKGLKKAVQKLPNEGEDVLYKITRVRDSLKYAMVRGVFFEELGFTYIGPVDGHKLSDLLDVLRLAKTASGPVCIHLITTKGKGYKNAETFPERFHGTVPFNPETGEPLKAKEGTSYSNVFGNKLYELAKADKSIVAVSAAMVNGTGLKRFYRHFPKRTFDVGIAEEHAVTFAAGMAITGLKPVVAIYSTFLQRAYDEMMIDVCMQKLPVVFAIDRAGIVGSDGETHHGIFDLTYLNSMPNMTVLAPANVSELENMLAYAINLGGPCAIRYPRGDADTSDYGSSSLLDGAIRLFEGKDVALWAAGNMVKAALQTAVLLEEKGISVSVVNARFVRPLDETKLREDANNTKLIVTMEDNSLVGGFGSNVMKFLSENGINTRLKMFGWPRDFIEHGSVNQLFERYGLTPENFARSIEEELNKISES